MSKGDREHDCDEERGRMPQSLLLFAMMINLHNFTFGKKDDYSRSAYMICFPTVSSNFLLLHTYDDVFKEKEQIPLKNHMDYNGEQYKC